MPKVSILLPVYNGQKYLASSIQSVLNQSFKDWEILVINDGSTDESLSIIERFSSIDPRIKIINFEKNVGLVSVLNEGVKQSSGIFLARIDSDDEWIDSDKLKKQVEFLDNHPEYALVGTGATVIDEDGGVIGRINFAEDDKKIRKNILIKNQFIHSSVLVKKEAVEKCYSYQQNEKYVEDYGLWLRVGQVGKFKNLSFVGINYRINLRGETATKNRQQVSNSFKLAIGFKSKYPNFWLACVKWTARYLKALI